VRVLCVCGGGGRDEGLFRLLMGVGWWEGVEQLRGRLLGGESWRCVGLFGCVWCCWELWDPARQGDAFVRGCKGRVGGEIGTAARQAVWRRSMQVCYVGIEHTWLAGIYRTCKLLASNDGCWEAAGRPTSARQVV
jgi:hypothetical protein